MQYGFVIEGGDVHAISDLSAEAESAGWDGVFIADALAMEAENFPAFPWFDPWVVLAAMAMRTKRVRIGTIITPVPRRRPWKLARETVTLDQLSGGRLTLGVGLGADRSGEYRDFGETTDARVRGEMLDEGLAVLTQLWSGEEFSYEGQHY